MLKPSTTTARPSSATFATTRSSPRVNPSPFRKRVSPVATSGFKNFIFSNKTELEIVYKFDIETDQAKSILRNPYYIPVENLSIAHKYFGMVVPLIGIKQ